MTERERKRREREREREREERERGGGRERGEREREREREKREREREREISGLYVPSSVIATYSGVHIMPFYLLDALSSLYPYISYSSRITKLEMCKDLYAC